MIHIIIITIIVHIVLLIYFNKLFYCNTICTKNSRHNYMATSLYIGKDKLMNEDFLWCTLNL